VGPIRRAATTARKSAPRVAARGVGVPASYRKRRGNTKSITGGPGGGA
jgi:hypothetical protein